VRKVKKAKVVKRNTRRQRRKTLARDFLKKPVIKPSEIVISGETPKSGDLAIGLGGVGSESKWVGKVAGNNFLATHWLESRFLSGVFHYDNCFRKLEKPRLVEMFVGRGVKSSPFGRIKKIGIRRKRKIKRGIPKVVFLCFAGGASEDAAKAFKNFLKKRKMTSKVEVGFAGEDKTIERLENADIIVSHIFRDASFRNLIKGFFPNAIIREYNLKSKAKLDFEKTFEEVLAKVQSLKRGKE